ncbi:hypothetical protein EDC04DRAFT_2688935 [Pisolithus marmoratus]|nr:hypothetical protein EDC04DRAFT_2688935 [Pisolithus marmoratus]
MITGWQGKFTVLLGLECPLPSCVKASCLTAARHQRRFHIGSESGLPLTFLDCGDDILEVSICSEHGMALYRLLASSLS